MVKLYGPLLSVRAAGSFAKTLVYGENQSGPIGRFRGMPQDPHSQKQAAWRSAMQFLGSKWPTLGQNFKDTWINEPLALTLSPFHAFCHFNLLRFRTTSELSKQPTRQSLSAHPTYDPPTIEAVDGRAVITVPNLMAWGAWGVYIWRAAATSVPMDLEHCIRVTDFEQNRTYSFTDIPAGPGHYFYQLRPFRDRGYWSPLLPELDVVI